jgi:hypothetical protein
MVVCSWDVGITHLAYCILEKNNHKKIPYKIHEWVNINLMCDDDMRNLKCKEHTKNGKICDKRAKYYVESILSKNDKSEYYGYCELHKENAEKYIDENECIINASIFELTKLQNHPCCHIIKSKGSEKTCDKSSKYECLTLDGKIIKYFCKSHYEIYYKSLMLQYALTIMKKSKIKKKPIKDIQVNLINILDSKKYLLKVDEVIIENQPSLKNPTMKSIASTLFNYFVIRGIVDKNITGSKIQHIQYICPSNKLKINNDNTVQVLSKSDDGKKYKLTKDLGIKYCQQLLKHDDEHLNYLNSFKKKDDLSDAFLQGVYYIDHYKKKNKLI